MIDIGIDRQEQRISIADLKRPTIPMKLLSFLKVVNGLELGLNPKFCVNSLLQLFFGLKRS